MNTQTEQIKAEIERIKKLIDDNRFLSEFEKGCNQGREDVCDDLIYFINTLPQKEANAVWHDASEKPKPDGELTKEWCEKKMILVYHSTNNVLIHKAYEYRNLKSVIKWAYIDDLLNIHKQEEVSEDLEEAVDGYTGKVLERINCLIGNQPVGEEISKAIKFGANWQKEQMMKGAVEGTLSSTITGSEQTVWAYAGYGEYGKDGDKVKLIIVKED